MIGKGSFDLAFVEQQIAVTENRGEKIIEIVRDACSQLTERFHFLRPAKLILKLFARGNVHEGTDQAFGRAAGRTQNQCSFEDIDIRAIGAAETVFAAPMIGRAGKRVANRRSDAGAITGVKILLPETDVVALSG